MSVPTVFAFYGTLQQNGGINSGILSDQGTYGQPCLIRGELYDVGKFPALVDGDDLVIGQLWTPLPGLERKGMEQADWIEGYDPKRRDTSLYLRRRVLLADPKIWAFTYFWNDTVTGLRRIDSGDWSRYTLPRRAAA